MNLKASWRAFVARWLIADDETSARLDAAERRLLQEQYEKERKEQESGVMPRFGSSERRNYRPEYDSSYGFQDRARAAGCVMLNSRTRTGGDREPAIPIGCPCGCGDEPVGRKKVFLMGHDARLRGKLIRAHLTGTKIQRFVDGEPVDDHPRTAASLAADYGMSFIRAIAAADRRVQDAERTVVQRALNSKRLIRVGRWEYTGRVAAVYETAHGDEYEIEYVTRQGERKRARVPASQAPPATDADAS